ncbi:MAG TPA: LPS export ABC transporter periplasmic protein LptC [Azospirillaceae bacterium]|nr:LPS export ABC transporter periplasmic protein LptC [Azospirillaceae bacterium]
MGRGYSRFVSLTKILFGLAAIGVVVGIASWPSLQDTDPVLRVEQGSVTLVNAVHSGTDKEGRPYSINAQRAWRPSQDAAVIDMIRPFAEITTSGGAWISISAERGRYNEQTGKLLLLGSVRVNQDNGYEFGTEEMHYLTGQGIGWGDRAVSGQGAFGEINAEGFRMFDSGRTVVFSGPSRAKLTSAAGAAPTGGAANQ